MVSGARAPYRPNSGRIRPLGSPVVNYKSAAETGGLGIIVPRRPIGPVERSRPKPATARATPLFFLLSGENPTLPPSEVEAVLGAEGFAYRVLERLAQVLRVEADVKSVEAVRSRAAMTRVCCAEAFRCRAVPSEILEEARRASLEGFLEGGETFVVRVRRVGGNSPGVPRLELERRLGGVILGKARGVRVSLRAPQKTFLGVLTEGGFVFGLRLAEVPPKPLLERRPWKRPFFHPSSISAKLARCMVNLARPGAGDLVLDPFCGTASILVEAGLMGLRVVGLDVKRHMVEGSLRNLRHYGVEPEGLAVADARRLPVAEADCVVTDPPYGRSTTTIGLTTRQIVRAFLSNVRDGLAGGKRICMASPKSVGVSRIGRGLGLRHLESHFAYVHRSLTREIAVFEVA